MTGKKAEKATGESRKVSECVGAGAVVVEWLVEKRQIQLAHTVVERIVTINRNELGEEAADAARETLVPLLNPTNEVH